MKEAYHNKKNILYFCSMKYTALVVVALILSSCYISKSLERDVPVRIDMNIPVSLFNNGNSTFLSAFLETDYQQKFVDGMKAEFAVSRVIVDNVNPEFEVKVASFTITESTSTETVKDTTSEDNGKTFELSKLDLSASGTVTRLKDNVAYSWTASKDQEEKVKSNRTVIQLATGQNKETNQYREKEFSASEAGDLAVDGGRRSGNSIVKEILRSLK